MKAMEPLYAAVGVQPAYQLRWSLAIFSKQEVPPTDVWLDDLKSAVERDDESVPSEFLRGDDRRVRHRRNLEHAAIAANHGFHRHRAGGERVI